MDYDIHLVLDVILSAGGLAAGGEGPAVSFRFVITRSPWRPRDLLSSLWRRIPPLHPYSIVERRILPPRRSHVPRHHPTTARLRRFRHHLALLPRLEGPRPHPDLRLRRLLRSAELRGVRLVHDRQHHLGRLAPGTVQPRRRRTQSAAHSVFRPWHSGRHAARPP